MLFPGQCSCSLLYALLYAVLLAASISHFLTAALNFHVFLLWNSSPLFSITRSSSFSVISYPRLCKHKKWRRKRHDFAVVFSFEKSGPSCDFLPNKTLSCIWVAVPVDWVILHWYGCGADGRSVYGHVITKCSWLGRLPHFLSYGAPPTLRY